MNRDGTRATQCEFALAVVGRAGPDGISSYGVYETPGGTFRDLSTCRARLSDLKKQGKIVNVGGTFGMRGRAGRMAYSASKWGLRGITGLSGYRYYDGNLIRLGSNGMISGYYPLLGGALAIGNVWPSAWTATPVPDYYVDYYGLGDDYRYFDGALYRLDPQSQAIETIAALLTAFEATGGSSTMGSIGGDAAGDGAASSGSAGAGGPPAWAQRMRRSQRMTHAVQATAHAVRSGDAHGGGSSVNLSESDR